MEQEPVAEILRSLERPKRAVVTAGMPYANGPLHLGHLAGFPLDDPRVRIHTGDVADLLRTERDRYDAIMLDVDNGPEGFTRKANDWLYARSGLRHAFTALRSDSVLAVWSAGSDREFSDRLARGGFHVEEVSAKARGKRGGSKHHIWLATRT